MKLKSKRNTAQKMKFSINDFFSKCDQIGRKLDLLTFTEEILNGKLHFLCSENQQTKKYKYTPAHNCFPMNFGKFLRRHIL